MQSLGSKEARCVPAGVRARFADLARERFERYGGAFARAALLYRALLAAEGHRNYPLRAIKLLRGSPDLLLPIAPVLAAWGARLARWPAWSAAQRAEVVTGLVDGCRRVAGQQGYQRALSGFDRAYPGGIEAPELAAHYATAARRALKDAGLRRQIGVRRESFEASLRKRVRTLLER
jgi:hypothetical protein